MAHYGGGFDPTRNRHPSVARQNGREAIREALQHHVDRLAPNTTKSEFSGPRQPQRSNTGGGGPFGGLISAVEHPIRSAQSAGHATVRAGLALGNAEKTGLQIAGHDLARGWRHPQGQFRGGRAIHGFNPYDVLGQLGRQTAQMFNPATKQGLANIVGGFAGGPEGMGEEGAGMGGRMPPGMEPYNIMKASEGGKFKFGRAQNIPNTRDPMASRGDIISAIRSAKGVGGYRRPVEDPFQVMRGIEQKMVKRDQRNEFLDENKNYFNTRGRARQMQRTLDEFLRGRGANPTNYLPHHQGTEPTVGNHDIQPHDYTDRLKAVRAYDNPEVQQAFGGSPDPIRQALYDMLFGGKGLLKRPQRPGLQRPDSPYGSPYGGGPFG